MNSSRRLYQYFVRFPLLISVILLLWMGVFARRGWLDWQRMVHENHDLQTKMESVRLQKEGLVRQVDALQNNPKVQERVVRQILGFVKKDETIIEF
jgi:cell division protein FtsB